MRLESLSVDPKVPPVAVRFRGLNIGCGSRHHPAWTNLDLSPQHPSVIRHDVAEPLPFAAASFDAVYHSHLLEHLPRERACPFLTECARVLRVGGILRVAVPDLEQIARLYLASLEAAVAGEPAASERRDWMVLELYDQTVRTRPGGDMLEELTRRHGPPLRFALDRLGADGPIIHKHLAEGHVGNVPHNGRPDARGWRARLAGWLSPRAWRRRLIRWLLGADYELLEEARFRRTGEVHCWMYDRLSLPRLMRQAGFAHVRIVEPGESDIAGWEQYALERDPAGQVLKPDSLFAEGIRR